MFKNGRVTGWFLIYLSDRLFLRVLVIESLCYCVQYILITKMAGIMKRDEHTENIFYNYFIVFLRLLSIFFFWFPIASICNVVLGVRRDVC